MEHILFVEPVEQGQLLAAEGGVIGGIDVEDDMAASAGVGGYVGFEEYPGKADQLPSRNTVFQAGDCGLGGEIGVGIGGVAGGDLDSRVGTQGVVVVRILVAEGDGINALAKQRELGVPNLAQVSGVSDGGVEGANEASALFDLSQEGRTGVGGDLTAVEGGGEGFAAESCEGELGVTDCAQRALLFWHVFLWRNNMLEGARSLVYLPSWIIRASPIALHASHAVSPLEST
nr:hypothetical protein [Desulfacinum hydrothermale]